MNDRKHSPVGFLIELWPSPGELDESKCENAYLGNLTEYYRSYNGLFEKLKGCVPTERYTDDGFDSGESICRNAPPELVEILVTLTTTGLAAALYKLLSLWIQEKNGRKFRVAFDGFEFEATQLSEKQFVAAMERIVELRRNRLKDCSSAADQEKFIEESQTKLIEDMRSRSVRIARRDPFDLELERSKDMIQLRLKVLERR
jgi:hypothetical protein